MPASHRRNSANCFSTLSSVEVEDRRKSATRGSRADEGVRPTFMVLSVFIGPTSLTVCDHAFGLKEAREEYRRFQRSHDAKNC